MLHMTCSVLQCGMHHVVSDVFVTGGGASCNVLFVTWCDASCGVLCDASCGEAWCVIVFDT